MQMESIKKRDVKDFYQGLSYVDKMRFKAKAIQKNTWSPDTFHRRIKANKYKPGEQIILDSIIENFED